MDVVIGKGTGAGVVAKKVAKLGLTATKEQVAEITKRVKNEASLRKWSISMMFWKSSQRMSLEADDASQCECRWNPIRQSTGNTGCRIAVGLIHGVEKRRLKLGITASPYSPMTFLTP